MVQFHASEMTAESGVIDEFEIILYFRHEGLTFGVRFLIFRLFVHLRGSRKLAPPVLQDFEVRNVKRSKIVVRRVILRFIFVVITGQTVSDTGTFRMLC